MTPKKRIKRSSLSNEGTQIPGSVEEPKPSEGGQISDHSTEEGKKRKDSSVSWDSVLCGSGRKRSRKTSDSEDEPPKIDNHINKKDVGSKHGAESAQESSNEVDEILAYSPKQAGSPSESDGGSTWKSLKRLVTPKRKAKDEDESKDNVQSDSDATPDESSFSIKKLLPGQKKRKSAEKQDQVSSDEADKDAASGDEDSDTPAVVPLSEFDTVETEVHIQTQADVESHIPKEADSKLQQDLLDQMAEPVLPCDSLQTEAKKDQENDDALENKASTTPDKKEEHDDSDTESLSKPQLSDIPEEATPASATEEAARDDTIAEDLVEITSEAFTAPEPLDNTLADETEMISAVSQLSSESSKTSGNTTPVPADYVVMETDELLHQVVENISISPKAVPVCSDELRSERIVVSRSHQILETFVKKEATILEIHRGLDATDINTVLNVEELDAINELAATTQTESTSEVNDSVSTEIVSEVATEEFDTAEIAVDEVHDVDVTHPEESLNELESIDDYLVESLSEVNAAVSTDLLPKGDEIVPDEGSLVEAHQNDTDPPKMDSQEADSAATVADETKDGSTEQEVKSLTEKEDQMMHNITDQIQAEDKDQPLVEVEKLQELAAVQAAALDSEEGRVQSLGEDVIPEDIPAVETVAYKLKEEIVPLAEVNVEPEQEDELDAAKPEHVQGPEASEAVQASTFDSEEGRVQSPNEEVKSEDILLVETVDDESKQTAERLTEISVKPEHKELPANAIKTVQEPEVLESVQAPTSDSLEGSVQSPKEEEKSEDTPPAETVTDEPKEETIPLTEANFEPVDTSKEPEVLETVQAPTLDSEEGSVQSLEKEVISEDVPEAQTVTDEPKDETMPPVVVNLEPVDASKTEHVQEPEALQAVQGPEVLQAVQASTSDSSESSVQLLEKEAISEDVPEAETVTDEPKKTAEHFTEVSIEPENKELPANAIKTVQEPEVLESVQAPTSDSSDGSVQSLEKEVISEDAPDAKTVTDEPKDETMPPIEVNLEPVDASKTEHVQEPEVLQAVQGPEVLQAVQASTLDSEEGSVQSLEKEVISENVPEAKTVTDEPKKTAEHFTEVSVEPENKELPANAIKTVQEPEVLESVQAPTSDSSDGSVQSLEKEAISEDVPEAKTVTDEPKDETMTPIEVNLEPVDASKTEHVQEPEVLQAVQGPEVLQAVQASTLDSEEGSVQSLEKEVISEDVPEAETVTDEPKKTAEHLAEVSVEPENKELPTNAIKTVQEPEVLESVQAPTLDSEEGSGQLLEKEVISEDVPEAKTVTDEPKDETMPPVVVNIEPVDASKTEHVQEPEILQAVQGPEVLQAVQASTSDSSEGGVQSLEKEAISENVPEAETVTDVPKEETIPLNEAKLEPVDASKTECVQEPQVLQSVQAPTLDSVEGSVQSLEKEAISEHVPEAETVTDEPKEETTPLTGANLEPVDASQTEHVQEPENKELPANAVKTVQEPKILESIQAPTSDSAEGSVQSPKEEVKSEDTQPAEIVTDEPKEETIPLTGANLEPVDTSKEPEVLETVQAPTLESEEGSVQSLEKEVISEDVPEAQTIADEPKEETTPPIKVNFEPEEATKTEHVKEPEVLEAVQAATVDSEVGSLQSLEKEVISEDIPAVEKVTDEPKQETEVDPEEKLPVEAANVGHVQEPEVLEAVQADTVDSEVGSLQSLEKEVISEDITAVEKVTDEPKQETDVDPEEKLPVEATKTEHQEPEALPSDVKDIVMETKTDEETSMFVNVVTESIEGGSAQELVKQILSEDVPKPDVDNVVASVTDGLESEVVAQLDPSLEIAEDQKTESIPQDVRVEQEDRIPEVVEELQILTAVCVSSVNEEASNVQVLEKTVFTGETQAPCVDNAAVTKGPEREVHLSAVQVSVEAQKESELPGTEVKTAAVEHTVVTQVVICNVKDLSAAVPDVLIKKTSPSTEPWIDRVASELVVIEEVETATPLVKDDVSETAKEGSVVMMMHVPSVEFEDNHRIQVQVVADDIKSAETIVDTLLEVGVTEAKEVIDVCNETVKKVANLSATPEIEEELINEENKVSVQEVIQNVKENLPETVSESVVVNLEQEGIKQPDAVTEVSEMAESESKVVEDQKTMEESIATLRERQDEAPTVISEVSSTQQRVSEDLMQTPDRPGSLDVSIQDQKDDLEETERDKPEAGIAVGEVKSNQINHEGPRIIQSPIVPPSNTELVAPQNTGIISSTGNVESLSSLSIPQFGQANAPASPPPTTEIFEPVKKTDVSEVEVQAVEVVEPVKPTKQIELTEIAVQATETTEPAQNFNSTERAVITAQPVLLDINIQAMETIEPVEQINSTERVTSSVQATETIQPVRQTEKREVILSPPVLSEDCDQSKEEEPVKRKEEDKDVWMDAEEDVYTQKKTEMSLLEVEESVEPQTESKQKEKAGQEVEIAPKSKNEEEESQQEMYKTARTSEFDSDGEDFAVALEHPEMETARVTTMECN
ncbi:uncharacterized protein akap12a [Sebastes fasciatus]|uniref:uncharacterized protein akap12a n=1 Tax=Sebastes fasciatus TaxID=394691 RepID=UPI003D9E1C2F